MDLNIILGRIRPEANYRLSRATPPHKIIEWRGSGTPPTQNQLQTEWDTFLRENKTRAKEQIQESLKSEIQNQVPEIIKVIWDTILTGNKSNLEKVNAWYEENLRRVKVKQTEIDSLPDAIVWENEQQVSFAPFPSIV